MPGRALIEQMAAALGEQYSLILFPEGTRGNGEKVGYVPSGVVSPGVAPAGCGTRSGVS